MINKNDPELSWISLILRAAVVSIFAVAAFGKFSAGLGNYADHMAGMFKDTFLPDWLLIPYINILPFAETLIAIWLLVGINLRYAWIFTALVLLSLGFGMVVAKQGSVASENYLYMMMACLGIYLSKYDGCSLIGCGCKK
jgi:hypothetical protein